MDLPPVEGARGAGRNAADEVEAMMAERQAIMARGGTPPPLFAGATPVYSSDGNCNAFEAMGEAGHGMVGVSLGGLRFLPGNTAAFARIGFSLFEGDYAGAAWEVGFAGAPAALRGLGRGTRFMVCDVMKIWCFAAGTPIRTPDGAKLVEHLHVGDLVLARPDSDPRAAVEAKEVEEVFVRYGPVLNLHVSGRVVRTTGEHPFWVWGAGWVPAKDLKPGDLLSSDDGQRVAVECLTDSGEFTTLYNFRVAEYATYFVGGDDWGFSVWAHNTCDGLHHYLPLFMGSQVKRGSAFARQILTPARQIGHTGLHRALNRYLEPLGMAPSAMNTGRMIRATYSGTERLKALVGFYKSYQGGAHFQGFMDELTATLRAGLFS